MFSGFKKKKKKEKKHRDFSPILTRSLFLHHTFVSNVPESNSFLFVNYSTFIKKSTNTTQCQFDFIRILKGKSLFTSRLSSKTPNESRFPLTPPLFLWGGGRPHRLVARRGNALLWRRPASRPPVHAGKGPSDALVSFYRRKAAALEAVSCFLAEQVRVFVFLYPLTSTMRWSLIGEQISGCD